MCHRHHVRICGGRRRPEVPSASPTWMTHLPVLRRWPWPVVSAARKPDVTTTWNQTTPARTTLGSRYPACLAGSDVMDWDIDYFFIICNCSESSWILCLILIWMCFILIKQSFINCNWYINVVKFLLYCLCVYFKPNDKQIVTLQIKNEKIPFTARDSGGSAHFYIKLILNNWTILNVFGPNILVGLPGWAIFD